MEGGRYLRETIESQEALVRHLLRDDLSRMAGRVASAPRVFLVGTGTSFHGAMVGEHMFRSAGREAWALPAFEFVNYQPRLRADDALILISHRGTKRFSKETLEAFAAGSNAWLVITGEGSPLEGEGIIRTCPQEKSSVHTASHVGTMVRLGQLARTLASGAGAEWNESLAKLPGAVASAVQLRTAVASLVPDLDLSRPVHFVGAGPAWATALEGALKLSEASYVPTVGHELENFLHGPLVSVNAGQAVVVVTPSGPSLARAREVVAALAEIGAAVITVGSATASIERATWRLPTANAPEVLAPMINVVPLQWLAYEVARRVGVDPDPFRKDERPYAAAQEAAPL